jgi:hypothetical protein
MNKRRQQAMQAHRDESGRFKPHPGFDAVKTSMAERIEKQDPKISAADAQQQAAAELAAATRRASPAARKGNSHLKRVK